ncbi:MAG: tyrosine-type recombinase/integrase [Anaerolineae bacterium]|jgi:site-specific recombinase XerD
MTIDEAIDRYLDYLKASRSVATADTYATGLNHLRAYLQDQDLPPDEAEVDVLAPGLVTDFITWLYDYLVDEVADGDERRVSESTKATYFAALSSFLDYLVVETEKLPMDGTAYDAVRRALARASRRKSQDKLPPDKLPSEEVVSMLREEVHSPVDLPEDMAESVKRRKRLIRLRDIAIVEALLSSGMRVGELVRLERGHLLYDVKGALVKYGKGKKDREVLFSDRAWTAIQRYLRARADGGQGRPLASLPVFARHDRGAGSRVLPLSTRSVQNTFVDLASRAGIMERFHLTPHTLRHYFATKFLSQTGDLALTQYALGHASPATTRIYAQTKREDYRRAHGQVFRPDEDEA